MVAQTILHEIQFLMLAQGFSEELYNAEISVQQILDLKLKREDLLLQDKCRLR